MKYELPCCVVRDLLPSYIENLTSEESAEAVKAHIDACPECQKLNAEMSDKLLENRVEVDESELLKKTKKKLRKKRVKTIVSIVLCAVLILFISVPMISIAISEIRIHFNESHTAKYLEYYNKKAIANIESLIGRDKDEVDAWVQETFAGDNLEKKEKEYSKEYSSLPNSYYINPEKNVIMFFLWGGESRFFIEPYSEKSEELYIPLNSDYINKVNSYCSDKNADYKNPPAICELALYDFSEPEKAELVYYYLINYDGTWGYHGDMEEQHNSATFVYDNDRKTFSRNSIVIR